MKIRTYSELIELESFKERFEYLKCAGSVGLDTFGFDRYLNQQWYKSSQWRHIRDQVILRDLGCDLAHQDFPIHGRIIIHHINPLTEKDILDRTECLTNLDYLITTSFETHNALHYGSYDLVKKEVVARKENDTTLW